MSLPTSRSVWLSNPKQKYRIIASPDPLTNARGNRTRIVRDDIDRVFWVDPGVKEGEDLDAAITSAVAAALTERLQLAGGGSRQARDRN